MQGLQEMVAWGDADEGKGGSLDMQPPYNHDVETDNLLNLLAVIHRDGGHYTGEHGIKKSAQDAEKIVIDLLRTAHPVDEHAERQFVTSALWLCYHALKAIEWEDGIDNRCPYCGFSQTHGHGKDCMVGNGLKAMEAAIRAEGRQESTK